MDKQRQKTLTVISLGAGVQSSTMAIMAAKGDLPPVDCAIFSDTQNESRMTYLYLDLLKKILPFPVYVVSKGNIMEDMLAAKDTTNFVDAPYYTKNINTGKKGLIRRQCTFQYKINPIRKKIRELCGVGYKKKFPKDKYVSQWIGISTDEVQRMKPARDPYILNRHPLIEANMSRKDCVDYLKKNNIPLPEKSACIVCPFHNDAYWHFMKTERPSEFKQAIDFDKQVRNITRKKDEEIFVHKSCLPLDEVEFDKKEDDRQLNMFNNECEGMCGV